MADETVESGTGSAGNPVGQAFVAMGEVRAIAPDGSIRLLEPNSPIFFNEKIVTGGDGRVSILFPDGNAAMLTLGRNSEIVIDEDVVDSGGPDEISDAVSEV